MMMKSSAPVNVCISSLSVRKEGSLYTLGEHLGHAEYRSSIPCFPRNISVTREVGQTC